MCGCACYCLCVNVSACVLSVYSMVLLCLFVLECVYAPCLFGACLCMFLCKRVDESVHLCIVDFFMSVYVCTSLWIFCVLCFQYVYAAGKLKTSTVIDEQKFDKIVGHIFYLQEYSNSI